MIDESLLIDDEYYRMLESIFNRAGTASKEHLKVAETVRPKLVQDGMFLVGLDIVGAKILEINVFSPGALWSASTTQGTNFAESIIAALEQKVAIRASYAEPFANRELATF
jgi:glutathione synthase